MASCNNLLQCIGIPTGAVSVINSYTLCIILLSNSLFLQDFIISHNQQHVIELDANLPPKELFKVLGHVHIIVTFK